MMLRPTSLFAIVACCVGCGGRAAHEGRKEGVGYDKPAAIATNDSGPLAFFEDKPLDLWSPDGRYRLLSEPAADGVVQLVAVTGPDGSGAQRHVIGTFEPPTSVLWSPRSDMFILNDQRGSGQTSYLEIIRLEHGRFRRDGTARRNLAEFFIHQFECDLPQDAIVTSGESWFDSRTVIANVQATLHSGGCPLDPFATNQLVLLVDARTGELQRRRLTPP